MGNSVTAEDQLDIRSSLDGDEKAYARLVKRYEAQVAAQMWRFTRDRTVLEELVQDVFVEAYLSLPGFSGRAPFLHWLRKIATRVGYRYWKNKIRDEQRQGALTAWHIEGLRTAEVQPPSEAAELLHSLLLQLPPKDRLVLSLFYFEECDTREIAKRTGWSRTLVKVRAHRARQKLRILLEEAGFGRDKNGKSPE